MDRAIVTPSFITLRFPDSERITFRPLGPTVRETASASLSIPTCKFSLHSLPKDIFFGLARTTNCGFLRRNDENEEMEENRFGGKKKRDV